MSVKILIKRKIVHETAAELMLLLKRLRSLSLDQSGYICGETLRRIDKSGEYVVVSSWRSIEEWNSWVNNPKRIEIQSEIDKLLGEDTGYEVYSV